MQHQLSASKQLLETLSARAALWKEEHDSRQHHQAVVVEVPEHTPIQHSSSSSVTLRQVPPEPSLQAQQPNQTQQQQQQRDVTPSTRAASAGPLGPDTGNAPVSTAAAAAAATSPRQRGSKPASRAPPAAAHDRHHVLLLQHALHPLTHSQGDASQLRGDALKPHAAPKAKQVYDTFVKGIQRRPWYMLTPDGLPRLLWDLLLFVFIAGLVIYIPILIAFTAPMAHCAYWARDTTSITTAWHGEVPAPSPVGVTFLTLTNAAFLVDIILNFLTGVMCFNPDTNLYETSYELATVAARYAKTWLVLDVISCLPMECILTPAGVIYSYNLGHVNRLLKVAGGLRRAHGDPFRIISKIPYLARNFNYSLRLVVASVSLLLLALHYFACALWLVLRVQGFPPHTWPVELGLVAPQDVYQQWTWSVFAVTSAMIGLGYGSFPPVTFPEAVFWIVEMILMAGGFAVVNGFIFSSILEFLADQARYKTLLVRAQKEVEHRRLSPALARRVLAFYELKHSHRTVHMPIESIMSELEPGLHLQVALASVGHLLAQLPVLRNCPQLLQRVALLVEPQVAAEGQLLALPGTRCSHLYFVTQGFADVFMGQLLLDTLAPGDSFGEGALLPVPAQDDLPPRLQRVWSASHAFSTTSWPTLFAVRALSNCSLMVLNREAFWQVVAEYGWAVQELQRLGQQYASTLEELPMLEEVWGRAEAFDPLRDPLALPGPGQGQGQGQAGEGQGQGQAGEGQGQAGEGQGQAGEGQGQAGEGQGPPGAVSMGGRGVRGQLGRPGLWTTIWRGARRSTDPAARTAGSTGEA